MPNEESVLIGRAQAGDVAAFEDLIQAHQARLLRFVLIVAGNAEDAEDALQETLLQAYRALPRFRGDASFSTWLHRIAINTTRNWVRSQARASSERIGARMARIGATRPPGLDEELLQRERGRVLRDAILNLPEHYRTAVLLRHYQDMSYEEIAQATEVPIGTVRSRIAQGRRLLLDVLERSGYFTDCGGR